MISKEAQEALNSFVIPSEGAPDTHKIEIDDVDFGQATIIRQSYDQCNTFNADG